jgi:hypothetical protein
MSISASTAVKNTWRWVVLSKEHMPDAPQL